MKPITLYLHNFKKWRDLKVEFPENGVLLVKGPPDQGKTSVLQAIDVLGKCGKSENLLNRGSDTGSSSISFVGADGLTYDLKQDLTADKDRFLLAMPNGVKTRKVSDIQTIVQYNPFTLDEFITMSYTAEGRRKQRDILIKIMPKAMQDEFFALEFEEGELTKKSPSLRKDMESSIATLHTLKASVTPLDFTANKEELILQGTEP
jgi:recombinational DNA repair ATPase RecF